MKKIALSLFAAATLSACMGTTSGAPVMQTEVISTSGSGVTAGCASVHMRTTNGLPMRCGPQTVKPYTFQ